MRLDRTPPLRWWSATIEGEPASKATSRRVVRRGKFTRVIKSQKALDYVAQLREQIANAPLRPSEVPAAGNVPAPSPASQAAAVPIPHTQRPRGWLSPRNGWLR